MSRIGKLPIPIPAGVKVQIQGRRVQVEGPKGKLAYEHNAQVAVVSAAPGAAFTAKLKGFEGDACPECGNFTMVRNGTCLKCTTCGGTTGCS